MCKMLQEGYYARVLYFGWAIYTLTS